jgi:[ribosomal protein S5]-alanine N-acetyltransferase
MSINFEAHFPSMSLNDDFDLREHNIKDIDAFRAYYTNPNVAAHILATPPKTRAEAESEIHYCRNLFRFKRGIYWTIARKSDDLMAGAIGITMNTFNHRGELHYDLAEEFWNMGLMSASIKKCVDYAFDVMGLIRMEAITVPENLASQRVLLKNKFTLEGRLRSYKYFQQNAVDIDMFGLIPSDRDTPA